MLKHKIILFILNNSGLTDFEKQVLIETIKIKKGTRISYKKLAEGINRKNSYRAVGNALHKNPLPIIIPCHRVIGTNNNGGYRFGRVIKKILIFLGI